MKKDIYKTLIAMFLFSVSQSVVFAKEKPGDEAKQLSGISIVGNKEAPKSLYIVPWKNSEVGVENSLNSGLLDESMRPVDKEVFMREIGFYNFMHKKDK